VFSSRMAGVLKDLAFDAMSYAHDIVTEVRPEVLGPNTITSQ